MRIVLPILALFIAMPLLAANPQAPRPPQAPAVYRVLDVQILQTAAGCPCPGGGKCNCAKGQPCKGKGTCECGADCKCKKVCKCKQGGRCICGEVCKCKAKKAASRARPVRVFMGRSGGGC